MRSVLEVGLGGRSYPIDIQSDCVESIRGAVEGCRAERRRWAFLLDSVVGKAHERFVKEAIGESPVLQMPGGEKTKSLESLGRVYDFLAAERLDRGGRLFVVGGGVIGDLGGFAAASYLRGIDFFQVPTTLLAMVDSSVGGKTGINIPAGKNLVGAFHQPKAVFVGTSFLESLPEREFSAGMAEVIKYGLLADAELFERLRTGARLRAGSSELPGIIRRCCEIKAEIVQADEKEEAVSGGRALLNLGHTFGHAIEQAAGYGEYLHGEAVAIGLVMAGELSRVFGSIDVGAVAAIRAVVRAYDLPDVLRRPLSREKLLGAMKRDKKVKSGRLRFVALKRIGEAVTVEDVAEDDIANLWRQFGAE